jgi:hypothetical protein
MVLVKFGPGKVYARNGAAHFMGSHQAPQLAMRCSLNKWIYPGVDTGLHYVILDERGIVT